MVSKSYQKSDPIYRTVRDTYVPAEGPILLTSETFYNINIGWFLFASGTVDHVRAVI